MATVTAEKKTINKTVYTFHESQLLFSITLSNFKLEHKSCKDFHRKQIVTKTIIAFAFQLHTEWIHLLFKSVYFVQRNKKSIQ